MHIICVAAARVALTLVKKMAKRHGPPNGDESMCSILQASVLRMRVVAQSCPLLYRRVLLSRNQRPYLKGNASGLADCKSAIRQSETLRYGKLIFSTKTS